MPVEQDPDAYYDAYDTAKKQHLLRLLHMVDVRALKSLASRLRDGISSIIPALEGHSSEDARLEAVMSQMGGQNCHLDVVFEDGVVWLARIRLDDPTLPPKLVQNYIFLSEVHTLRWLERVEIPTPKVFHYEVQSQASPVGVPFLLMEKLKGSPLQWDRVSKGEKSRVVKQLVDVFLELEKHPFDVTGSISALDEKWSSPKMGAFAQPHLFSTPETPTGPFETLKDSLQTIVSQQLRLIRNRELSSLAIDHDLVFRYRRSMIPSVLSSTTNKGPYFLKHFDDKGDHILVDDEYNITGIIDWEFASAEVKELAFSSPCMLWPVGDFYSGSNVLSHQELEFAEEFERRGRQDLASMVRNGRRIQRFLFFLGGRTSTEEGEFQSLFNGLRSTILTTSGEDLESYEDWKARALGKGAMIEGVQPFE
ncbi:MAG: hypothetical protein M1833_006815 [Piccolia ochrophora]|nr:MAG: hypothetical protein M1833_006815 [Piccolia ochrophora]